MENPWVVLWAILLPVNVADCRCGRICNRMTREAVIIVYMKKNRKKEHIEVGGNIPLWCKRRAKVAIAFACNLSSFEVGPYQS